LSAGFVANLTGVVKLKTHKGLLTTDHEQLAIRSIQQTDHHGQHRFDYGCSILRTFCTKVPPLMGAHPYVNNFQESSSKLNPFTDVTNNAK